MFLKRQILPILEKHLDDQEVLVLTGFRRVGKSTLIKHLYDNLKTDNKLFLDMESPVNQQYFSDDNYDSIALKLQELGINYKSRPYVFLDEIQFVKEIPSIVKYLFDHYNIKFVLTGSSSFYLKNHFTESLSGRKFIFELTPLTFEEFLIFKKSKITTKADYGSLSGLYNEYVQYGGLPGVVLEDDLENKKLKLDDALGSYFQLDVVNLASFKDIKQLRSLLFLLVSRVGSKLDIQRLSDQLGISRPTLYSYLEFLEETYLIHQIPSFSKSPDVLERKVKKLYFFDTGILNHIGSVSEGALFENKIFNQLYSRMKYGNKTKVLLSPIYYFQKKSGLEIDFISNNVGYEVKLSGTERDLKKLQSFGKSLNLNDCYLITKNKIKNSQEKIIYPFVV